jgi:integrase
MPRHRRRRGYIEELPSKRYRAVVYAGVDPLTGSRRNLTEVAATHEAAEIALTSS